MNLVRYVTSFVLSNLPNAGVRKFGNWLQDIKIVCTQKLSAVRYYPEVFDFSHLFCLDFGQLMFSSRLVKMKRDGINFEEIASLYPKPLPLCSFG
jgi:hypothetical protein